jgi:GH15 family glucan-1,4-alpha-glucosidase
MATFPPIAHYAFLSDCDVSTLIAADGTVEWLCLPRPDSPSVFGALLDRSAGSFRFAPSNARVPDHRRYVPGTNVLETTWHTPSGWLIVHDLLVMGPPKDDERPPTWRRVPGDATAQNTLLRIATCASGQVEVQADGFPMFDYGATTGTWAYRSAGYHQVTATSGDLVLDFASSLRLGIVGSRVYGRSMLEEGDTAWIALSWGGDVPASVDESMEQLRVPRSSGGTGWVGRAFPTTLGVRTSNGARSRSRA